MDTRNQYSAHKPLVNKGLIFEVKCIFENKPLSNLGLVYCWNGGGQAYLWEDLVQATWSTAYIRGALLTQNSNLNKPQ